MLFAQWLKGLADRILTSRKRSGVRRRRISTTQASERLEDRALLAGVYTFDNATFMASEGNATNTVNVVSITRDDATAIESVDVVLTASAGTEANDFTAGTVNVSFGIGEFTKSVPIEFVGDTVVETNETIDLSLTNFSGTGTAGGANPTASLQITNNDSATVTISAASASVAETDVNQDVVYTVSVDAQVEGGFTVDLSETGADTEAGDFSLPASVTFGSLDTADKTFNLTIVGDQIVEATETAVVAMAISGTTLGASITATDTDSTDITDDDTAIYSIDNVTVNEADGTMTFTVSVDSQVDVPVDIDVSYTDGTAAGGAVAGLGTDFDNALDTVSFGALDTANKTVTVAVFDDIDFEGAHDFTPGLAVNIGTPTGTRLINTLDTGTGTINDNDTATEATFTAPTGNGADSIFVVINGGNTEIRSGSAAGPLLSTRPTADINTLTINGAAGEDDTVTVDLSANELLPAGGITFNGGAGGNDELVITGGTQGNVTYTYNNANDGSVAMTAYGTVNYTGLEPVTNDGTADNIIFNLPGVADATITLADLGGGMARLESTASTFEDTDFAIPAAGGSITINMGANGQTITITSLALNADTDLTIDGGGGSDTISLNVAGGLAITGALSLTAETINQTGAVTVTGTTTLDAGAAGTITLAHADNDFGGAVTITSANDATFTDTDDITLDAVTTTTNLTVDADSIDLSGAVSVGGVADLNATSGAITQSGGTIAVTGNTILSATTDITLDAAGNDFTTVDITGAVNATLVDTDDITLDAVTTTTNQTVDADSIDLSGAVSVGGLADLTATAGDITQSGGTFDADTLTFNATGSVTISESSDMDIVGVNTADSADLDSTGAISDDATASIVVTDLADLNGTDITIGDTGTDNFMAGSLRFTATGTANITENDGTAFEATSSAPTGIITSAGAMSDFEGDGADEISATDLTLTAVDGVGVTGARIHVAVTNLDVSNSTTGAIFVTDTAGGLILTDLGGPNANAVNGVGGGGEIRANSPLTFASNASTTGGMTYTSSDSLGADDITVNAGITVEDTSANLTFNAGDTLVMTATSTLSSIAGGAITINLDGRTQTDADAGVPATFTLNGTYNTGTLTINGNDDAAGTTGDTFNISMANTAGVTTALTVNGNDPVLPGLPGDVLNIDSTGVSDPTITPTAVGNATYTNTSGHVAFNWTSIETVTNVGVPVNVVIDLSFLDSNGAGVANSVDVRSNVDGGGNKTIEVRVEGVLVYTELEANLSNLRFLGNADADQFSIVETAAGLPTLLGSTVGLADGGHTNAAFDAADAAGLSPSNVSIHFEGNGGVDSLSLTRTTAGTVSYFSDDVGGANSGVVNVDGIFTLSFDEFAPLDFLGAGVASTLVIDATSTAATTTLTVDDDFNFAVAYAALFGASGLNDGVTAVVGDGGFESTRFANYGTVIVRGGDGSELITLNAIDMGAGVDAGVPAVNPIFDMTLSGENTTSTDAFGDTIDVLSLPTTVTLRITGDSVANAAGGADTITIGNQTAQFAVVADGNLDPVDGPILVSGGLLDDTLNLDDSSDASGDTGLLTSTTITGLDMANGITYGLTETVQFILGSGNDTFNVQSTLSGTVYNLNTDPTGGAGDDTVNVSSNAPTNTGNLDAIDGQLNINTDGGRDDLNLSDSGDADGDNYVFGFATPATQILFGDGAAAIDIQFNVTQLGTAGLNRLENFVITGGTGDDTFTADDDTAGSADLQASFFASTINTFNGNTGDDTFTFGWAAGFSLGGGNTFTINGNDPAANPTNRDVVNLEADEAGDGARAITMTYQSPGSGDVNVRGLKGAGGFIDINTVEQINYTGDAGNNDTMLVEGVGGVDDVLAVTPLTATSANVFLNGGPMLTLPPGTPATNLPGLAGGSTGPDININGIINTGLSVDGNGAAAFADRLVVNAPTEAVNGAGTAAGWLGNAFGSGSTVRAAGDAFDTITITDTNVSITNQVSGLLLQVNYGTGDFTTADGTAEITVNTGEEASVRTFGVGLGVVADDVTVTLSTNYQFQINGGAPALPGAPPLVGDRLNVLTPNEANIFSDLATPPNVSITSSIAGVTTQPATYNNIELLTVTPGNNTVNLLGDNGNAPGADQDDRFMVFGQDVDFSTGGDSDGANEIALLINGSNPIFVLNTQRLNVFGFENDDDLTVDPFADNTARGWGIDVRYDGGANGANGDDLFYGNAVRDLTAATGQPGQVFVDNTPNGSVGGVTENVILEVSSTAGAGQLTVDGVVTIDLTGLEDVSVNLNDNTAGDIDTFTLVTSNAADSINVNFTNAGNDATGPLVDVDSAGGTQLMQVESFAHFTPVAGATPTSSDLLTLTIDGAEGNDTIVVTGNANRVPNTSLNIYGQGGDDTLRIAAEAATGALVGVPVNYDGGTGSDTLQLAGNALSSIDDVVYNVGPAITEGRITMNDTAVAGTELTVDFHNLEPVQDNTPAATLTINATGADNAISYTAGAGGGIFGADVTGLVTVDGFESYEFSNKTALTVNGQGGSDSLSVNNGDQPTGLTTINLNGGDASGDSLTVRGGIAANLTISGTQITNAATGVTINYGTVESITAVEGLSTGLTLTGSADYAVSPGAQVDEGTINSANTPVSFVDYGAGDTVTLTGTGAGTLTVNGTSGNDTITAGAASVLVAGRATVATSAMGTITVNSGSGDDATTVTPAAGVVFNVESGTGSDTVSVANGATGAAVTSSAVTVTGLGAVNYTGTESVALTGAGTPTITGGTGDDSLSINPSSRTATINSGATISFTSATTVDADGGTGIDTVTVNGTGNNDTIGVVRAATTAVTGLGATTVNVVAASENLLVSGGVGNDTVNVSGTGGSALVVDGGAGGSDGLSITLATAAATNTLTAGTTNDAGAFTSSSDGTTTFVGVDSVSLTGAAATDDVVVQGTQGDDTMTLGSAGGANRVWLNERPVVTLATFDGVTLNGRFGRDTLSVQAEGLTGIATVTVNGGDTAEGDTLLVSGTTAIDTIGYTPSATDVRTGSVAVGAVTTNFSAIEAVSIDGLGGVDVATLNGTANAETVVLNPAGNASGTLRVGASSGLSFTSLETVAVDTEGAADTLVVNGSANNDTVSLSGTNATVNGQSFTLADAETIVANLGDGDDTVTVTSAAGVIFNVNGGDPASGSDVLTFTSAGATTVNLGSGTIEDASTAATPDTTYTGIESLIVAGGANAVTVSGTGDNDVMVVTPSATADTATVQANGALPVVRATTSAALTVAGGADTSDVLVYHGTDVADTIALTGTTISHTGFKTITYDGTSESLVVNSRDGNDTITLTGVTTGTTVDAGSGNDTVTADATVTVALSIFGGDGNDALTGGNVIDSIYGGNGNDTIIGGAGADHEYGEAGNDLFGDPTTAGNGTADDAGADFMFGGDGIDQFVWEPGDGSDVVQGGDDGADILRFFGSDATADAITVTGGAAGTHLNTTLGAATVDTHGVEQVFVTGRTGGDTITVNDVTESELEQLVIDVTTGDSDSVIVNGRDANDTLLISTPTAGSNTVNVVGLAYTVQVNNLLDGAGNDTLTVNGNDGDDNIKAVSGVEAEVNIVLNGGQGDDYLSADATLNGNDGNDFLEGGAGNDTMDGGAGDDTFVGGGGTDAIGAGTTLGDVILSRGTSGTDAISLSLNATGHLVETINSLTTTYTNFLGGPIATSGVEQILVQGLAGSDSLTVDSTNGAITIPISFDGGDPIGTGDALTISAGANSVTFDAGPESDSGSFTIGGATGLVSFDHVESLTVDGTSVAGNAATINGDSADNDLTLTQTGGDDFTVSVDGQTVTFTDFNSATLNGGAGDDDVTVSYLTGTDLTTTVAVNGQSPTGNVGDTLQVEATTAGETIAVTGTTITVGTSAAITYGTLESLSIDALGGTDTLTVTGSTAYDYTPGAAAGSGTLLADSLPIGFTNLGSGETLNLDGASLVAHGTDSNNAFVLGAANLTVDGRVNITRTNLATLTLDGLAGDDSFAVSSGHGYTTVNLNGGSPSNTDVATLTGDGTAVTATLGIIPVTTTDATVSGGALGTVNLSGVEVANVANGAGAITVQGEDGNDTLTVNSSTLADTATIQANGLSPVVNATTSGTLTVAGGAGAADTLVYNGTSIADTIAVTGTTISHTGFKTITYDGSSESLVVNSRDGNDTITLTGVTTGTTVDAGSGNDTVTADATVTAAMTIFGGDGNDALTGGNVIDSIYGGNGNDTIIGGAGADHEYGEAGNDLFGDATTAGNGTADDAGADFMFGGDGIDQFVWEPLDGSDVVQGGDDGADILRFFGSDATADAITVTGGAAGTHLNTTLGAATVDTHGVEQVFVTGRTGGDTITVNDVTETELEQLVIDVTTGDADSVIVNGRDANDTLLISTPTAGSNTVNVVGLAYTVQVNNLLDGAGNDTLTVNGNDGDDNIKAVSGVEAEVNISLTGGQGNDYLSADATLIGGTGNDTLIGGTGDDTINGDAGDDVIDGRGGVNTIDGGTDTDTILVSGTAAGETLGVVHTTGTATVTGGLSAGTHNISNMEQVRVEAGDGSDTVSLTLLAAGGLDYTVLGGNPIGAVGDTLSITTPASVVGTPGPDVDSGSFVVATTASTNITFDEIEGGTITAVPAGAALTVNGTNADDDLTLIGTGVNDFSVSVNDGPAFQYNDFVSVTLSGSSGDDDIDVDVNVANLGTAITIDGDLPASSGGDSVSITGIDGTVDAPVYSPTAADGGTFTVAGVTITIVESEHLSYSGETDNETLTVNGTAANDVFLHTPAVVADAGQVAVNSLLAIDYTNLGATGSTALDGDGATDDTLIALGTPISDTFGVAGTSSLLLNNRIPLTTTQVENFILSGLDGDDRFNITPIIDLTVDDGTGTVEITVAGEGPGASDTLNFTRNTLDAGPNDIVVELDSNTTVADVTQTIRQVGLGAVTLSGIETANINAVTEDLFVAGTRLDDVITYTPTNTDSGTFTAAGISTVFHFDNVVQGTNTFTITGGGGAASLLGAGGFADEVIVQGTNGSDRIRVNSLTRVVAVDVQSFGFPAAVVASLRDVTLHNNVAALPAGMTSGIIEAVRVQGRDGGDTFHVVPDAAVGNGLFIDIDGGSPQASDALVITNLDGAGNPISLAATDFVIVGQSRTPDAGNVLVYQNSVRRPNIAYTNTEVVTANVPFTNSDVDDANLLILGPDNSESNEFRTTATFLGSGRNISVDNLAIFPNSSEHVGVPQDTDYFRVVAQTTGTLDVQVYFKDLNGLVPGNGNLDLRVLDSDGTVIAGTGAFGSNEGAGDSDERVRIPAVEGETYFIRVLGGAVDAVNGYTMTIINDPAPVPYALELQDTPVGDPPPANSDTGRSQVDNITRDNSPTIFFRVDDAKFLNDLPGNSTAGTPPDQNIPIPFNTDLTLTSTTPGYRVAIFIEGDPQQPTVDPQRVIGFATKVAGVNGVYRFDFDDAISAADRNLTDGSHFISAKVQIVDPATPTDTGFGDRSQPLEIVVDTIVPPVFFGNSAIADDGMIPDQGVIPQPTFFIDNKTNDQTPTFWGTAEANAIIRVFADQTPADGIDNFDVLLGLTVALPEDGTNQFPNGQWRVTSTVDLNNPTFFPVDGLRRILVTAEDVAGNLNPAAPVLAQALDIFVDTQGPQVTNVQITSALAYDLFDPKSLVGQIPRPVPTPRTDGLTISFRDFPSRTTGFPNPALNPLVAENPGHYVLRGDANGIVPISTITFIDDLTAPGLATGRVLLTFDSPLLDDRYTLTINDDVVDDVGNKLDGESNATQPLETPTFPSGDGQPGGDFIARFTIDSRVEIGGVGQGGASIDINGNFHFDPTNTDFVNRDLVFDMGVNTDALFAGKFNLPGAVTQDGFDRIGAYGKLNNQYRWLLDFTNDGRPDHSVVSGLQINGRPIAGDFNLAHVGDEIGLFDGTTWYFDTNNNNNIDSSDQRFTGNLRGLPIVGDFDGDGLDDLGVHRADTNVFAFDLTTAADGTPGVRDGNSDYTIQFNATVALGQTPLFPGVLERPFAGDFNLDGIDDIGLMVPHRDGVSSNNAGSEFYIFQSIPADAAAGTAGALNHQFSPKPLGVDLYAQFGSRIATPLVGNFDPPPSGSNNPGPGGLNPLDPVEVIPSTPLVVTLPKSGGPFTVLQVNDNLHIRKANGTEVMTPRPVSGISSVQIIGSSAADVVVLDSSLNGYSESFRFEGANGADRLDASRVNFAVTFDGGAGNDNFLGGGGANHFLGGVGNDQAVGGEGNDLLDGGAGNDVLTGNGGADNLLGGAGNDRLDAGSGNDELRGGAGHDNMVGGEGNDRLHGEADNDKIFGSAGNDTIRGGAGNDSIDGGADDDVLLGEDGKDTILGGTGDLETDPLGSRGDDIISGGAGDDQLNGQDGNDTVLGGAGKDKLIGGNGNDILSGEEGIDSLQGDTGTDVLLGGQALDSFINPAIGEKNEDGLFNDVVFFTRLEDLLTAFP